MSDFFTSFFYTRASQSRDLRLTFFTVPDWKLKVEHWFEDVMPNVWENVKCEVARLCGGNMGGEGIVLAL